MRPLTHKFRIVSAFSEKPFFSYLISASPRTSACHLLSISSISATIYSKAEINKVAVEMADPTPGDPFPPKRKRTRIVRPYPVNTLQDALAVGVAIQEATSGLPCGRVDLARAMGTTPASSGFTTRLNSSVKYGLTEGGYNDDVVKMARRGEAIVAPRDAAERQQSLYHAALAPDVFRGFYEMLDGKQLPEDEFARNMIRRELAIRPELAAECLAIAKANGDLSGIVTERNGTLHVDLGRGEGGRSEQPADAVDKPEPGPAEPSAAIQPPSESGTGRIFIAHAGAPDVASAIESLLQGFGISCELADPDHNRGNGHRPVPAAVAEQMRACSSAIVIGGHRGRLEGSEESARLAFLIGAASVLYGERVIAVVPRDAPPSRLDGIRTVAFDADKPEESALALIRELHRAGIIRIAA